MSYGKSAELAQTATHCFIDKKTPFPAENLKFCQENGVAANEIQYLNEYLLNENSPKLKTFEYHGRTSEGGKGG